MAHSPVDLRQKAFSAYEQGEPAISIQWSAPEFIAYEYGRAWYVLIGVATALFLLWGIMARNYFFLAFIALAFALVLYYTKKRPRIVSFSIARDGVRAGNSNYAFSELKSFWILERAEGNELVLETEKHLSPRVFIPAGDADLQEIRDALLAVIPEKEYKESAMEQIGRSFGF